jgi:hypothetical protein
MGIFSRKPKREQENAKEEAVATAMLNDPEIQAVLENGARIVGAVSQDELQPGDVPLWESIAKRQHAVQLAADEILPGVAGLSEESVYAGLAKAHGHDLAGLVTYRMWTDRVRASDPSEFNAAETEVEERGGYDPWSQAKATFLLRERDRRGLEPSPTPMMRAAARDEWLHQQSREAGVPFWAAEDLTLRQTIWMTWMDLSVKEAAS